MPKPAVGEEVTDTEGVPQLSDAVGAVQEAVAQVPEVDKEILLGQLAKVGAWVSVSHGFPPPQTVGVPLNKTQISPFGSGRFTL